MPQSSADHHFLFLQAHIAGRRYYAMDTLYDASYIREFYDNYAARERDRLEGDPASLVNFHMHRHYLELFIRPGDHVLDMGAGPGRFTIELAKLGATVVVGDISPVQLEFNRQRVQEAGYEQAVASRELMDVIDLSRVEDATFDAVSATVVHSATYLVRQIKPLMNSSV